MNTGYGIKIINKNNSAFFVLLVEAIKLIRFQIQWFFVTLQS